jgi:hypothetical protein
MKQKSGGVGVLDDVLVCNQESSATLIIDWNAIEKSRAHICTLLPSGDDARRCVHQFF